MKIAEKIAAFSTNLKQEYDLSYAMRIRKNAIVFSTILLFLFLILEFTVDLSSTTFPLLISFFVANLFLAVLSKRAQNTYWHGHIQVFLFFLLIEAHILFNPQLFHTLVFWTPFVPMLSIFLISFRASIVWLIITLLSIIVNGFYGYLVVGPEYLLEARYVSFASGGLIFVVGFYITYVLMYNLIGHYYLFQQEKKEEISRLNDRLNDLNVNLEKKVEEKVADIQSKNKRLEKYSFMNAHIVRAPLANIMGAMDLYYQTEDLSKKEDLLEMVEESAHKLDQAVREVAQDLHYKPE